MLLGRYDSTISAKFQIVFPRKFQDDLGESIIITKGLENCLIVVSKKNWQTLLEGTKNMPFTQKATRNMQRFLLGNAYYADLDSKGRCVVPQYLREYAQIRDDIVFAGIERFVEVWDKNTWENEQKTLSKNIESIAERLNTSAQIGVKDE